MIRTALRIQYPFYRHFWNAVDLLFPPVCGGCGKEGSRWCFTCQSSVVSLSGQLCLICSIPVVYPSTLCSDCQREAPKYEFLWSLGVFQGPLRVAIHRLKYRRDLGLGEALAAEVKIFLERFAWPIDVVVPIPLGKKRKVVRGYNQVGLFGKPLSLAMGWSYKPNAINRERETISQVGLSINERKINVEDAFRAKSELVCGKNILLLDDVATTGATLGASADALIKAGAKRVIAVTLARALPQFGFDSISSDPESNIKI